MNYDIENNRRSDGYEVIIKNHPNEMGKAKIAIQTPEERYITNNQAVSFEDAHELAEAMINEYKGEREEKEFNTFQSRFQTCLDQYAATSFDPYIEDIIKDIRPLLERVYARPTDIKYYRDRISIGVDALEKRLDLCPTQLIIDDPLAPHRSEK